MIEETKDYIIKPYKNRQKHELYIHNKDLRADFKSTPIYLPKEDLNSLIVFDKKIIFSSMEYASVLKKLISIYINNQEKTSVVAELKKYFEEKLADVPPHVNLDKPDVREGYFSHMLKELNKRY